METYTESFGFSWQDVFDACKGSQPTLWAVDFNRNCAENVVRDLACLAEPRDPDVRTIWFPLFVSSHGFLIIPFQRMLRLLSTLVDPALRYDSMAEMKIWLS